MLPYGAQINLNYLGTKSNDIASIIGGKASSGEDLPHLLIELVTESGIPTNLGAFSVKEADCDKLSSYAYQDGCHSTNAREMTKELFHKMFLSAL